VSEKPFAIRRAELANDNKLVTPRDLLAEIVRAIDAGEVSYESVLVHAVCSSERGELETWRANLTLEREALLLLAAQSKYTDGLRS